MNCECNYQLGMGPNLICPVHGTREALHLKAERAEYIRLQQVAFIQKLEARISWALRCNRSGMVGFVPSLLQSLEDLDTKLGVGFTLRTYIEATEKEDVL